MSDKDLTARLACLKEATLTAARCGCTVLGR
jgi:hypothetical protein